MKQCNKCKRWLVLSKFSKDKKNKTDGHQYKCKECHKDYQKENKNKIKDKKHRYYNENKDEMKEYGKEYRKNNKERIIKYRSDNAKYESYKDKLTIDECPKLNEDGVSLEVKCRYCGKYFIPSNQDTSNRVQILNNISKGEKCLYCSSGCKESCPVFNKAVWPKGFKNATSREVQSELRQMVLKRDNYICQKCGSIDTLHCHHIYPLNESPITSADMDECITYCKSCHKEVHKIAGCNYHEMRCDHNYDYDSGKY